MLILSDEHVRVGFNTSVLTCFQNLFIASVCFCFEEHVRVGYDTSVLPGKTEYVFCFEPLINA